MSSDVLHWCALLCPIKARFPPQFTFAYLAEKDPAARTIVTSIKKKNLLVGALSMVTLAGPILVRKMQSVFKRRGCRAQNGGVSESGITGGSA